MNCAGFIKIDTAKVGEKTDTYVEVGCFPFSVQFVGLVTSVQLYFNFYECY